MYSNLQINKLFLLDMKRKNKGTKMSINIYYLKFKYILSFASLEGLIATADIRNNA
jgi:hypothetical protein